MTSILRRFLRYFSIGGKGSEGDGAKTISAGVALNIAEWKIVGLAIAVVALLKSYGTPDLVVFLLLWIGDIILSLSILALEKASGVDMTFMDTYRRMIEKAEGVLGIARYPLAWLLLAVILVWYGPAYLMSFFKGYFRQRKAISFISVVVLAGIQMAVWAPTYITGVDLVSSFLK